MELVCLTLLGPVAHQVGAAAKDQLHAIGNPAVAGAAGAKELMSIASLETVKRIECPERTNAGRRERVGLLVGLLGEKLVLALGRAPDGNELIGDRLVSSDHVHGNACAVRHQCSGSGTISGSSGRV